MEKLTNKTIAGLGLLFSYYIFIHIRYVRRAVIGVGLQGQDHA